MPPKPLNAPDGQQATGGIQPGVSNAIVIADKVIVFGPNAGVFVYSGTPALGNPPIFWATSSTVDPFGNAIPESSTAGIGGTGTFAAGNTLITPSGIFSYAGTPALGNLKMSFAPAAGTDSFGNVYTDNLATYNVAVAGGGYAQVAANPSTGLPFLVLLPPGGAHVGAPPQVNSGIVNPGAVNEQLQLGVTSGFGTGPGSAGSAGAQFVGRPNNGGVGSSFSNLISDNIRGVRADTTSYPMGHLVAQGSALPQTIASTSATTVTGCGAFTTVPGTYKVMVDAQVTANAAAGSFVFQISTTGTLSNIWGNGRIVQTAGAGAGNERTTTDIVATSALPFSSTGSGAVGATFLVQLVGYLSFTTAGAVTLQAFLTILADTFVINNVAMTLIPNF
jgi:hypothetical protein